MDFFHKLRDVSLIRYVAADCHPTNLASHAPSIFRIDVSDDHHLGAGRCKLACERTTDASRSACHNRDAVSYFHEWQRESTPRANPARLSGTLSLEEILDMVESGLRNFEK
jgi:hypothetical protein